MTYNYTSFKEFNGESLLENATIPAKDKNILGVTKVSADYLILEIPDLPEVYKNGTVFIYIPSTKRYGICEKAAEDKDNFISLKIDINDHISKYNKEISAHIEPHYTTTRAEDILNLILLHRLEDKKLSDDAYMWIEEVIMSEDAVFSEVINRLVKEGPMEDKDFDILGIDAHAVRGTRHGLKYKI